MQRTTKSAVALSMLLNAAAAVDPVAAEADEGDHTVRLSSTTTAISVRVDPESLTCTEEDFWGQCYVGISDRSIQSLAPFHFDSVARLLDGDCVGERERLLVAAGTGVGAERGTLRAEVVVTLEEHFEWGFVSDRPRSEASYCDHTLRQFVYLRGEHLPEYEYQVYSELALEPLTYAQCIARFRP